MVDEEQKRLKSSGGSSSQGPSYAELQKELKKTQDMLKAEQKKTADQAHTLAELERQVKTLDRKISLATDRKKTAIADLEKKNVEARGLEQRVKELMEQLDGEKASRSGEAIKHKDKLKTLQKSLEAFQAAFKEYQEAEPGRVSALKQQHIRSNEFSEKVCERMYTAFELAISATKDYLKSKGQLPDAATIPAEDYVALLAALGPPEADVACCAARSA
ncbi:uncharacterized protein LOC121991237 [Zingiber officinale]|uniref:uncharacterized protein LOC121991237 n=1 Tax=Zingiber officinale TaxID=94328 RepID=UPI001C4C6CEA|nr:uncharacterized protein LOC121991237 [Zingiber officinale]